jgi:hypothetical protein
LILIQYIHFCCPQLPIFFAKLHKFQDFCIFQLPMASRLQNLLLLSKRQQQSDADEEPTQVSSAPTNEELARQFQLLKQQVDSFMRRLKPLIEKDEWKQQTQNYSTTFFGDGPSNDVMPELIQEYSKICSDSLLSVQCFARGSQSLSILKNSWGEERRTLIARTAKALIDDFNGDANEEHQIPQQPPSDAVEEEHKLFQDRWRQLETAWKITRQSFDATIEKAVKLITAVSNGPVKFEPEASLILELHALAWIHHVVRVLPLFFYNIFGCLFCLTT